MLHEIIYLRTVVDRIERTFHGLHNSLWLQPPIWKEDLGQFRYRENTDLLLIFLKGIRYISLLNAAFVLLQKGYFQEMHILGRCMDETYLDAQLFLEPLGEDGHHSAIQKKVLDEFFQEEFEDYSAPSNELENKKRHRVSRDKISRAVASTSKVFKGFALKNVIMTIHKTFSGYVHGAYPHIMELLGGSPLHYHTRGMLHTPRLAEAKDQYVQHIYRGILFGRLAAKRLGMGEVDDEFVLLLKEMDANYDMKKAPPGYEVARPNTVNA